jgi:hypothetical protein
MKSFAFSFLCLFLFSSLLSSHPKALAGTHLMSASLRPAADHGGKIESKYDGFTHETVMTLKKMKVTCAGKNVWKDVCVSLSASLHCPGKQLDYVRNAKLSLIFETKDWGRRHSPEDRDLTVATDSETLRLGRMTLVSQNVDDFMTEVLETTLPYDTFRKIAKSQLVEMRVGKDTFELRERNLEAFRDLNNRVKPGN